MRFEFRPGREEVFLNDLPGGAAAGLVLSLEWEDKTGSGGTGFLTSELLAKDDAANHEVCGGT